MDGSRTRNGLREWGALPDGYRALDESERIEPLDVQRLNSQWFGEYPPRGMLVGTWPCGMWYRKVATMVHDAAA
jgi:hypothetical protein